MTGQMSMFDGPAPSFPRARRDDARSSHAAAALIERTGTAKAQAERVLAAVRRFPGSTSMELSRSAHIERYVTARRLPELVHAGLVSRELPGPDTEPCVVSHKRAIRWRPS